MEPERKNQIKSSTDREKIKINKRFLIYLFFLLVSVLLWYLNALGKDYITVIRYPVKYENFPKGKALISDLPEKLNLKVKGFGFTILRYKLLSYTRPITLPIENFRLEVIRKNNQYIYFMPTRYTREWLNNQLGNEIQLLEVNPDTLVFRFTDVVEKMVPVKVNLNIQFEKQFMQNGKLVIRPENILVTGPQAIIDTLAFVQTKMLQKKNLKDTLIQEVELMNQPKLTLTKSKVWIMLPIEKFTEKTFSIPIETDNAPEDYRVRTFPGSVSVSFRVGISAYDKITPYMFRAMLDYNSLIIGSSSKAKINLTKYPSIVQDIRFYPKTVDYLIEK